MSATDIDQPIADVHTMAEAALVCIRTAATTPLKHDTLENKVLGAFMAATHWVQCHLSAAATEGRLIERLVELEDEWETVLDALRAEKQKEAS